jgi:hypothetical protein
MPAGALSELGCPYSGTAADVPAMSKAGDSYASQSTGAGRHTNCWIDLQ